MPDIFDQIAPQGDIFDQISSAPEEHPISTSYNIPGPSNSGVLDTMTRPFKAQAYESAKFLNQGIAGFSKRLDDIAQYISDKTGLDKSGIFKQAAKTYQENADYWDKKAQETGTNVIDEIMGAAVGGAVPGISEFMLNAPYSALSGAAEAHKRGESELAGAATEGLKRGLLGQIFHGAGALKQPYSALATGGAMAAQTASEGGSPEDIAKSAAVGGIYGAMGGGDIGLKDIKDSVKSDLGRVIGYNAKDGKPIIDMEAKPEPAPGPKGDIFDQITQDQKEVVPSGQEGKQEGQLQGRQEGLLSPSPDNIEKQGLSSKEGTPAPVPGQDFSLTAPEAPKPKAPELKQDNLIDVQPKFPETKIPTQDAGNPMLDEIRAREAEAKQGRLDQVEEIKSNDNGILKLTKSQRETLKLIRSEVSQGEAGYRQFNEGAYGGDMEVRGVSSTFPDYFQNKGYTKKETLRAIDKALDGKPLGKRQRSILEDLNQAKREQLAGDLKTTRASSEVEAWGMNEGDKFKRHGETYTVKKVEEGVFAPEVTISNSQTFKVDGAESLKIDRGTLEKKSPTTQPGFAPDEGFRREIKNTESQDSLYREVKVPVSDELFNKVGVKKANVFADYIELQKKHPEYFNTPQDVKSHVESVLSAPDYILPASKEGYTLLVKRNGVDKAAVVEFRLRGGKYRVRSAYELSEGQLEIKIKKAQRGERDPIPVENSLIQQDITQGAGVPSGTLHAEPSSENNIPPSPEKGKPSGGDATFSPDKTFRREAGGGTGAEDQAPQKRSDIVKFLREKLDLPIRVGRFRSPGALGIFKLKPEVVRSRLANDIETISHEIGHGLQKYLWPESVNSRLGAKGMSGEPFKAFSNELNPIATRTRAGQAKETEGFAEFVRLYVTNEAQARQKAPGFYKAFEARLEKEPAIRDILLQAREDFNRWIKQPSMARVLAQLSIGQKERPPRDINTLLKEAYTASVDDLFPLRKTVQEMTGKDELPAVDDPYKLARLLRGWQGKAESFLEYKPFNFNDYAWEGKSLKDILKPIGYNLDEFRAYIVSKRALELKKRGIESGVSRKDAESVINSLEEKYSKPHADLLEYQDGLLRYLRDSGVVSPKNYARMKEANRDYVPFYRVFEGESAKGTGKGLEANDPVKRIKGSWRDITDPLESIVKNTYLFVNVAERNAVGRALVDLAESKEGMGKFVERIPTPLQKITVGVEEVLDKWAAKLGDPHLKEIIKDLPMDTVEIFRKSAFVPKDNVISVWRSGRRELYEVSPDIARAFQALDKESTNAIVKVLSYPARLLRAGATLTPEFIMRNPIRDQFSAFVNSKYGFVPGVDLARGVFHVVKGDELYWQWKKAGGEHSMLVSLDRDYLQKNLETLMQSKGAELKGLIKNPVEALRALSEFGEAGTRVGEFGKGVRKEGDTKKGVLDAAFSSRESTIDFARIGAKTKALNSIIAFWNANVQGMDRMIRAFKDRPIETTFKTAAAITLPSVLLTAVNRQDDRWKEIPKWQKDMFWIVMTKDHIYRIPKPFELGILFGSFPERITEYILDKDPHAFDGLLKSIANGSAPGLMPNVASPFIENWANKSLFTDRPLVPHGKESLPPEYQYQPYTTEAAKKIGTVLARIGADSIPGVPASPAKVENLIRGWTGGLGSHALNLADMALRKSGALPDKVKPTKTLSDIPFVKAFAVRYPGNDAESIQRFYEDYDKAKQTLSASKEMIRESEKEKARGLLEEGDIIKLDRVEKALQRSNKLIDSVYYNPDMTSEEKRQLIDKTYLNMIDIARNGNRILEKAKEVRGER